MLRGARPYVQRHEGALKTFFSQQRQVLTTASRFDDQRWNDALTPVLLLHSSRTAQAFGNTVARRFGVDFDVNEIRDWLRTVAFITAKYVNLGTKNDLAAALVDMPRSDALDKTFTLAASRAPWIARSKVNTAANVGRQVAAEIGGAGQKTWMVTSGKPRSSHASLSGESVRIGSFFSNGAKWPGDPNLSVDERANCACYCDFGE